MVTALLGPVAIGLYGIVTTTAMTMVALRRVGIDEAFVQQRGRGRGGGVPARLHAGAGPRGGVACLLIALAAPVVAALYDDERLLALTLAVVLPADRVRAAGAAVDLLPPDGLPAAAAAAGHRPARHVLVAMPLAARRRRRVGAGDRPGRRQRAGRGRRRCELSPYPLALRLDRDAIRRYLRFSWPIFAHGAGHAGRRAGPDRSSSASNAAWPPPASSRWRSR